MCWIMCCKLFTCKLTQFNSSDQEQAAVIRRASILIKMTEILAFRPKEFSCLAVSGLAHDASEREVHILFSGCDGYGRCMLQRGAGGAQRPYAFVQFDSHYNALIAMESRRGTTWDVDDHMISIEIAKEDILCANLLSGIEGMLLFEHIASQFPPILWL